MVIKLGDIVDLPSLSFGRKFALIGVVLVVTLLLSGTYIFTQTAQSLDESEREQFVETSERESQAIEQWLSQYESALVYMGTTEQVSGPDAEAYLSDELNSDRVPESARALAIVDLTDDEVVSATSTTLEGENASALLPKVDTDWLSTNEAGVSRPYTHDSMGENHLSIISPLSDDPDRAVLATVDMQVASNNLFTGERGNSYVVHSDSYTIFSTLDDHINETVELHTVIDEETYEAVEGTENTETYILDHHGVPRISAASDVGGIDWVVVSQAPAGDAFALHHTVRSVLFASGGIVLFALLFGSVVAGRGIHCVREISDNATAVSNGELDVAIETDRNDEIGQLTRAVATMRDTLRQRLEEVDTAREEAEAARQDAEEFSEQLQRRAIEFGEVMQRCPVGDLTARMDEDVEAEALAYIATEFNEMIEGLEILTSEVHLFADEVETTAKSVRYSCGEVKSTSQQVSESVQQIADGADQQTEQLQVVDNELTNLSTTIQEIASRSNTVAEISKRTARTSKTGEDAASDAMDAMDQIKAASQRVNNEMDTLSEEMKEIDDLVEVISRVADRTKMLALNTEIEASRSKGQNVQSQEGVESFSVVSSEVKDLSEETKSAAAEIEKRIKRLKNHTEHTADEVADAREQIQTHQYQIETALSSHKKISKLANRTHVGVEHISAATEEQAAATQQVGDLVKTVGDVAEETATETETVAASAEEQTSALEEITDSSETLTDQAINLSNSLDRFNTNVEVSDESNGSHSDSEDNGSDENSGFGSDKSTASTDESQQLVSNREQQLP